MAVLNGSTAREIKVPLSFLGEGTYRGLLVRDRKDDPAAARLEEAAARRGDIVTIDLSQGGGFIGRFYRD